MGGGILAPQQIALLATSLETGETAYIPGHTSKDAPGDYMMELSPAAVTRQLGPQVPAPLPPFPTGLLNQ